MHDILSTIVNLNKKKHVNLWYVLDVEMFLRWFSICYCIEAHKVWLLSPFQLRNEVFNDNIVDSMGFALSKVALVVVVTCKMS